MAERTYSVNRGVNKPVQFKGLQGQYIAWVAGAVGAMLVLFGILYVAGTSAYVCVPLVLGLGALVIVRIYRMNKRFGQFGMMKWTARRGVPKVLVSRSRKMFIDIRRKNGNDIG
jgi:hypothetical protein